MTNAFHLRRNSALFLCSPHFGADTFCQCFLLLVHSPGIPLPYFMPRDKTIKGYHSIGRGRKGKKTVALSWRKSLWSGNWIRDMPEYTSLRCFLWVWIIIQKIFCCAKIMCHTFGLIMFLMVFYYSLVIAEVFEGDVKPKVFFFNSIVSVPFYRDGGCSA